MTARPPYRKCAVCGLMCTAYVSAAGATSYSHPVDESHEAVPVPLDEPGAPALTGVCDFDSTPQPPWTFLTRADAEDVKSLWPSTDYLDDGLWAACNECAELILAEKWDRLLTQAVERIAAKRGVPRWQIDVDGVQTMHRYFREAWDRRPPRALAVRDPV